MTPIYHVVVSILLSIIPLQPLHNPHNHTELGSLKPLPLKSKNLKALGPGSGAHRNRRTRLAEQTLAGPPVKNHSSAIFVRAAGLMSYVITRFCGVRLDLCLSNHSFGDRGLRLGNEK